MILGRRRPIGRVHGQENNASTAAGRRWCNRTNVNRNFRVILRDLLDGVMLGPTFPLKYLSGWLGRKNNAGVSTQSGDTVAYFFAGAGLTPTQIRNLGSRFNTALTALGNSGC